VDSQEGGAKGGEAVTSSLGEKLAIAGRSNKPRGMRKPLSVELRRKPAWLIRRAEGFCNRSGMKEFSGGPSTAG